jgi:class 3 adenylate cyclase
LAASLLVKDPAAARFLSGGLAEAEALLATPLPEIPSPEIEGGKPVFLVRFHPASRQRLHRVLRGLLAPFGHEFDDLSPRQEVRARDQAEHEEAIGRVLRSIRSTDRRLGLENLFWLAFSREIALVLDEITAKFPAVAQGRYALQPVLSNLYRRLAQKVERELNHSERVGFLAGAGERTCVIDSVLDDGFAFTESSFAALDVSRFLSSNRRYRVSAQLWTEFSTILTRELERRLKEGDKGLVARIARHAPGVPKDQLTTVPGLTKLAFNPHVFGYLMADAWQTGSRLQASHRLKSEAERRSPADLADALLDFASGLRRFEMLSEVRDRVATPAAGGLEDSIRRERRLYDFGEGAQVLNNAVNATVLFLDLRGFTKTSEGLISERDLTRELYLVFDAFVPHVRRFGGTVDKFLGDGMMVTYGTDHADPLGPLNALRTAILCQESLHELRTAGKTEFKMGVSVHYGRVYLARFIAGETETQNTVIGRNVNLAGRLSSAAKKPMDEDEFTDPGVAPPTGPDVHVTVDATGALFNEGIAFSRAAFVQLETEVQLEEEDRDGVRRLCFRDEEIARRIRIRYAGDAKFKGVKAAFPVFEVDWES